MSWLETDAANNLEQTYINGFLDVSGGNIINRNGNIIAISGDINAETGNLNIGGDVSKNSSYLELAYT